MYTPGSIWTILTSGTDDIDVFIDVHRGLSQLPMPERTFLTLLAHGQTGRYALHESELKGNQTVLKRRILLKLTAIINGES